MKLQCVKLFPGYTFFVELDEKLSAQEIKAAIIKKAEQQLRCSPGTIRLDQMLFRFSGNQLSDEAIVRTVSDKKNEHIPIHLFPSMQSDFTAQGSTEEKEKYELFLSIGPVKKTDGLNCLTKPKTLTGFILSDPHVALDFAIVSATVAFQKILLTCMPDEVPVLTLCLVNSAQLFGARTEEPAQRVSSEWRKKVDANLLEPMRYIRNPTAAEIKECEKSSVLPSILTFAAQPLWYVTFPANRTCLIVEDSNRAVNRNKHVQNVLSRVQQKLCEFNIIPIFKDCTLHEISYILRMLESIKSQKQTLVSPLFISDVDRIKKLQDAICSADDHLIQLEEGITTVTENFFVDTESFFVDKETADTILGIVSLEKDDIQGQNIKTKIRNNIKSNMCFSRIKKESAGEAETPECQAIPPIYERTYRDDERKAQYEAMWKTVVQQAEIDQKAFLQFQENCVQKEAGSPASASAASAAPVGSESAITPQQCLTDLQEILRRIAGSKTKPNPRLIAQFVLYLNLYTPYNTQDSIVKLYEETQAKVESQDSSFFLSQGLKFFSNRLSELELRTENTPVGMITKMFHHVSHKAKGDASRQTLQALLTSLDSGLKATPT